MTPDDEGREKGTKELFVRARQNIILELGYFFGKLGRERVCGLVKGNVETPSDYNGVTYISYKDPEGWRIKLMREFNDLGLPFDSSKV